MANTHHTINTKKKPELRMNIWEAQNKKSCTVPKDHDLVLPYGMYYTPFFPETS
jgi:hypothetical protein